MAVMLPRAIGLRQLPRTVSLARSRNGGAVHYFLANLPYG